MADDKPSNSSFIVLRNAFLSGALLLAPLGVTIWVFAKIVDLVGGTFRPLYEEYLPEPLKNIPFFWDLAGTIAVLILVTLLGLVSHYVFGRYFLRIVERLVLRIPGVGAVYNSVKQIVTTFGSDRKNLFNKVVLVQYPRVGCWSIGFLTNKTQGEPHTRIGAEVWSVFVPTTPNPTSGFLLFLPSSEVIELEMNVGDGMKMILSGGAVMPPWPTAQSKPPTN